MDINCDMGEGMNNEAALMPYISSANIACGYHAGDVNTMRSVITLCKEKNVSIGAHVSFLDTANFGRLEQKLDPEAVYELIIQQLIIFQEIATLCGIAVNHVKPHGALYNMSAKDLSIAEAIAQAVKDFDPSLAILCLAGSCSATASISAGLRTINEAFADRTYMDDGSLTPRSNPASMHSDVNSMMDQVMRIVNTKTVISTDGKTLPLDAQSICIHSDTPGAIIFAKAIHEQLTQNGIVIKAF